MTATTPRRALGGDENRSATPSATARGIVLPLIVVLLVVLAGLAIVATPAITAWDLGVIQAVEGARTPFLDAAHRSGARPRARPRTAEAALS